MNAAGMRVVVLGWSALACHLLPPTSRAKCYTVHTNWSGVGQTPDSWPQAKCSNMVPIGHISEPYRSPRYISTHGTAGLGTIRSPSPPGPSGAGRLPPGERAHVVAPEIRWLQVATASAKRRRTVLGREGTHTQVICELWERALLHGICVLRPSFGDSCHYKGHGRRATRRMCKGDGGSG